MQLLDPARHAHRPPFVAEVTLELAGDRRRRERRELQPTIGLEPFDRLEQADESDLAEIVERLAAVREATRQELGEPDVLLDELVPQLAVAGAAVFLEALPRVGVVGVRLGFGHRWAARVRCFITANMISSPSSLVS